MLNKIAKVLIITILFIYSGCSDKTPDAISFTILQLNDVYEISPMNNGKVAGLARVATLRNQLLKENPNTITVLSGDFLSPSVTGIMKIDGKRVGGAQMIETLNALNLDYATFGNHEFDLKEADLLDRLNESDFAWTTANTFHKRDSGTFSFEKDGMAIPKSIIHEFKNDQGATTLKLGIISVTLPFNKAKYVAYEDVYSSFKQTYQSIKKDCDVVIGMTHLTIQEDMQVAEENPDLLMILGGHEHANSSHLIGKVHVKKADANAKSAYVHRVTINLSDNSKSIDSELIQITDSINEDPEVKLVVDKWEKLLNENLNALGYDPNLELFETNEILNVQESAIRNGATNFTKIVMEAFEYGYRDADAYVCNSGAIRLDDELTGKIYQYDILKTFPYGGPLVAVELTSKQMQSMMEASIKNKNTGGLLQAQNINFENKTVNGEGIDSKKMYKVLMPSFLAAGYEQNLGFLKDAPSNQPENLGPNKVKNDIRDLVIDYLKKQR